MKKYTNSSSQSLLNSPLSLVGAVAVLITTSFVAYQYFSARMMVNYRPAAAVPVYENMTAALLSTTLPDAKVGRAYDQTFDISIPAGFYREEVSLANLPAGLEMTGCEYMDGREAPEPVSLLECRISGTPTATTAGTHQVGISVINEVKGLLLTDQLELTISR